MMAGNTSPAVLLVAESAPLVARIEDLLEPWGVLAIQAPPELALTMVDSGHARIVLCEAREGLRLFLERLKAAGAVPIVVGRQPAEPLGDVEFAGKPSDLIAAVFRSHGRLAGLEPTNAERVNEFAQSIASKFTLPELVKEAIARTRELCDADGASLLLVDPETGALCFDTVDGAVEGKIERVRLARGQGVAGKVAVEARPRLVAHAADCADFDPTVDRNTGFRTGSMVAVPLVLSGDVLGVLMAVRSVERPPFTPVTLHRLVQLSPHVAIAVHNVQITTQLRSAQTEALQANAGLEQKVRERTEQITRAKQEWERTFDAISEPIALLDGYVIRRANQAYARRVKLSVKELPGKRCHQVFAGRDAPCPSCPLGKGRQVSLSAELTIPNPSTQKDSTVELSGYWLNDDVASNSVVVTYHDVTQSRSMAERLRESERLAAVGQLASGAAHEINNPVGFVTSNLRSLRGVVDELRMPLRSLTDVIGLVKEKRLDALAALIDSLDEPDLETLDEAVEMIDESLDGARRVSDIVKGLRELSRLEIGRREPADTNSSVTRVVRNEFGEVPQNLQLVLEATVHADIAPLQLDQALGHLIKNARQATPSKERVVVRTWSTSTEVLIQVRDEGVGIAKEHLRRVFEPFFTTRGVGKGIGLGLTAAYGIVRRVGGDIEAESDGPGRGATFTVRLPRAEATSFAHVA
ncbi:MAG: GAF domain-containing protein [Myxococcaceae bacterium]|jgi:signal transduction histidine kinase/PAS domain-containing protein|nr:GAF domain-containing protein [Myxococcaceae bacterium]MCA3015266.1 GAF domain-containing protein [Myxococcaceae bacterium]